MSERLYSVARIFRSVSDCAEYFLVRCFFLSFAPVNSVRSAAFSFSLSQFDVDYGSASIENVNTKEKKM